MLCCLVILVWDCCSFVLSIAVFLSLQDNATVTSYMLVTDVAMEVKVS